jgi:hypothetical protein
LLNALQYQKYIEGIASSAGKTLIRSGIVQIKKEKSLGSDFVSKIFKIISY